MNFYTLVDKMPEPSENGMDLYEKHRPHRIDDVVGQSAAVNVIRGFKTTPRAVMLVGPSGTGKTTLARIMARDAGCSDFDLKEINTASVESALEMVREIENAMTASPLGGTVRAWILDEFQSLSRARYAQEAFLKVLEDRRTPHAKFFIATTDPKKILNTIVTRCAKITCVPITTADLETLVKRVAKAENIKLTDKVTATIVAAANGSARTALVDLQRIAGIEGEADRLAAVGRTGEELAAFKLVQTLMPFRGEPKWSDVAAVLTAIDGEDPEGVRQMVLASARKSLLRNGADAQRAAFVVNTMFDPLFDRNSGWAVLTMWCWRICHPGKN